MTRQAPNTALWMAISMVVTLSGCGGVLPTDAGTKPGPVTFQSDPYPSTYRPLASDVTAIIGATILTGDGRRIDNGTIVLSAGKITALGSGIPLPEDARIIDATGKWLTPGIIDVHSHLGVYPSPSVAAHKDGNEMVDPVSAEVWAEHSVWLQDPGFARALAGGVTALQILPGSANLFGGRSVTLKNVPSRTVQGMKFPGAPYGLKMACGENPKRVHGRKQRAPYTRMGNVAGYRAAWAKAAEYRRAWRAYYRDVKRKPKTKAPARDLELDTLAGVLDGDILVHNHCYRADEMAVMIDLAKEFGYRVTAFHHAVEAYKIADLLADNGVCAAMWADWWGFKIEAYDGIRENVPFVHGAGACAIVHSDSEVGIQRLNQEAAKAMADGNRAGLNITRAEAMIWLTLNPAKALGIDHLTGSLAAGKNADLVIWSNDPFSVYSLAETVYVDGARVYDRNDPARQPMSDFELGQELAGASR